MLALSSQKNNKTESLNDILDKLIKQTEVKREKGKNNVNFDNGEIHGNDSTVIYVKTTEKTIASKRRTSKLADNNSHNVTGEPKYLEDYSGELNNTNNHTESNQSLISEEIVVEMTNPIFKQNERFASGEQLLRSGGIHSDVSENYLPSEDSLNSYSSGLQKEPRFLSNYPDVLSDPDINSKAVGETINEIIEDLKLNEKIYDEVVKHAERLLEKDEISKIFQNVLKSAATKEINEKVDEYLASDINPLNKIATNFPYHSYIPVPQPVVRTIIHNQGINPMEQWSTGKKII